MAYESTYVNFTPISNVTATRGKNDAELGTRMWNGGKEYCYVYCTDQASIGHAVVMTGTTGYTVSVGTVTTVDRPLGWVQNTTLTTNTYGWVATRGVLNVQMSAAVSVAIGGLLTAGANGFMTSAQFSGATATLQGPACARALSNIASTASGYAYVW